MRHRRQLERQIVERGLPLRLAARADFAALRTRSTRSKSASPSCDERLAQQRAEQPDVVAQRLVRIVRRRRSLGFDWRMRRRRIDELVHDLVPPRRGAVASTEVHEEPEYQDRLSGEREFRLVLIGWSSSSAAYPLSRVEPVELRLRHRRRQ